VGYAVGESRLEHHPVRHMFKLAEEPVLSCRPQVRNLVPAQMVPPPVMLSAYFRYSLPNTYPNTLYILFRSILR
jgi:hypothetical protein